MRRIEKMIDFCFYRIIPASILFGVVWCIISLIISKNINLVVGLGPLVSSICITGALILWSMK